MNADFVPEVDEAPAGGRPDEAAIKAVRGFFYQDRERVFFSRQVEVQHEKTTFHWAANRAVRALSAADEIKDERRPLSTGGTIHLMWHRGYRFTAETRRG